MEEGVLCGRSIYLQRGKPAFRLWLLVLVRRFCAWPRHMQRAAPEQPAFLQGLQMSTGLTHEPAEQVSHPGLDSRCVRLRSRDQWPYLFLGAPEHRGYMAAIISTRGGQFKS